MLADKYGWTVAHIQASKGWTTEDKKILKLANKDGWTVAHEQAKKGWRTEDKEILMLATKNSWTVAHEQASYGWITTDPEILLLTNKNKVTVYEIILSYWNEIVQNPKKKFLVHKNFDLLFITIKKEKELIKNKKEKN